MDVYTILIILISIAYIIFFIYVLYKNYEQYKKSIKEIGKLENQYIKKLDDLYNGQHTLSDIKNLEQEFQKEVDKICDAWK